MTVPVLSKPLYARVLSLRTDSILFIGSLVFLAAVACLAALAPVLPIQNPSQIAFDTPLAGPSLEHPFGTDSTGRDLLARMIWGAQSALVAPLIIVIVSTVFGVIIGAAAGWWGGWIDRVLGRVVDVIFAFPGLLIAILAVAVFGKGIVAPVIAMCIAYIPYTARVVRNLVMSERTKPYVAAYQVQGFSSGFSAVRGVLPNAAPVILAQAALNFGYALLDLAALSFLGLGVQPPTADWGAMVNEGRSAVLAGSPFPALIPAAAIVVTVVAFNIVGDHVSDRIARRSR